MPDPERAYFQKPLLIEGEPFGFQLVSPRPDGEFREFQVNDTVAGLRQGQFRGDVAVLEDYQGVVKTALPTKSKYGVPLGLLRSVNEGMRPFLPQHFEVAARLECVGQKILRLLVAGYFGMEYYVPEAFGYTRLVDVGWAQVIEKIDFRTPHAPDEIERVFEAQRKLTQFCRKAGLVEFSGQIHEENPLAPPNLVIMRDQKVGGEKEVICWLDTLAGISMRRGGLGFIFRFHREISRQTLEEGGSLPALNRIHVKVTREFLEDKEIRARVRENIGDEGLEELEAWLQLYVVLGEQDDWLRGLSAKGQWLAAWRESPDVPKGTVEKLERSIPLYLLARLFGIKTVRYFLENEYRRWVNDGWRLPERKKEAFSKYKKRQTARMRRDGRIGPDQTLTSDAVFLSSVMASMVPVIRPGLQRFIFDRDFRERQEVTRYLVLGGARRATKEGAIDQGYFNELEEMVTLDRLEKRELGVYLVAFGGQQVIARVADYLELGNYILALAGKDPNRLIVGFLAGWVAPVVLRTTFIGVLQLVSGVDLSTAVRWSLVPKVGHYVGVPDQLGKALGAPEIRRLAIRSRVAGVLSLWPMSGWGTRSELRLWKWLSGRV